MVLERTTLSETRESVIQMQPSVVLREIRSGLRRGPTGDLVERAGAELIRGGESAEPAAVVFDAIHAAKHRNADVLIVDTAGRLHTKKPLMDELSKIGRVMTKAHVGAPHEVLLVIDGTVGQNALMQAKIFNEAVPITGVAVTKLDGTAKGGIVIGVNAEIGAPVKLIGIGEKIDDLRNFAGEDFVEALFEAETEDA